MIVIIRDISPETKKLLSRNADEQRFLYYSKKLNSTTEYTVQYETENDIWFSLHSYRLYFVKKCFLKKTSFRGFSLKNKKLCIFNRDKIETVLGIPGISEFLKQIGVEWFDSLIKDIPTIRQIVTKTMLEKVLLKKITNRHDLIKYYLKYSLKDNEISPAIFLKALAHSYQNYIETKKNLKAIKNKNIYLESLIKKELLSSFFHDCIDQALMLGRKIDCSWSEKRMKEEHNKMTQEIMLKEIEYIENVTIDYGPNLPELLPGMKILTTQREIFSEGSEMKHCIYTNYLHRILDEEYIVISYNHPEQRLTIGIYIRRASLYLDQIQGIGNSCCISEIEHEIIEWFEKNKNKFREIEKYLNRQKLVNCQTSSSVVCEDLPY